MVQNYGNGPDIGGCYIKKKRESENSLLFWYSLVVVVS